MHTNSICHLKSIDKYANKLFKDQKAAFVTFCPSTVVKKYPGNLQQSTIAKAYYYIIL